MTATAIAGFKQGEIVRVLAAGEDNKDMVGQIFRVEDVQDQELESGAKCKVFGLRSRTTGELVYLPFGCLTK